ncbi:MAG: thiamine pyrophosphate-dependent enzyme, partial [bacterium]
MNLFINILDQGIEKSGVLRTKISIVSDIPFLPSTTKELGVDFFHTMRGRSIAFATGLKLANPKLKVIPVVGDLITIGGNHLVHAARRNMDLLAICINSFIYPRIAGNPISKPGRAFSPYSPFEEPFNIPHLANSCGAVYTARWTALHTEQ